MSEFTHLDDSNRVSMVDVSEKTATKRIAVAESRVLFPSEVTEQLIRDGFKMPKGPVFEVARIAGIMAAKKTGELIPLCHPIGIDHIGIDIELIENEAIITCTANVFAKTGVEMEAMTGASIAALTIYDMCKAISHEIVIREVRLIEKKGGKSDFKK